MKTIFYTKSGEFEKGFYSMDIRDIFVDGKKESYWAYYYLGAILINHDCEEVKTCFTELPKYATVKPYNIKKNE